METRLFDHERLDVYQAAIEFVILSNAILEELPRGRAYLVDQLQRAGSSIVLNIAEGAGEYARYEKHRFYRMAKRSATECAAILDIAQKLGLIGTEKLQDARSLLFRIVSMLIKMVNSKH
jgi:four helix bundle protein